MPAACAVATEADASLYIEAHHEALRHKWIESQKQGRDLGESALQEWYRRYWYAYCRRKRLEHLLGQRRWREFEAEKFGQLATCVAQGDALVARVLDRFYDGMENLDIICWAFDGRHPVNRVVELLIQLDMNRARLEPAVETPCEFAVGC